MPQGKKGKQWYFGMKCHIGVDAESGLVHTVVSTAGNVSDISQAQQLLHGQEEHGIGDSGYQGVDKRDKYKPSKVTWHVAMRKGKRKSLDTSSELGQVMQRYEKALASVRAKVEHAFRIIEQQFGFAKVRYRGLAKNDNKLQTLFALVNLWMVRRRLVQAEEA